VIKTLRLALAIHRLQASEIHDPPCTVPCTREYPEAHSQWLNFICHAYHQRTRHTLRAPTLPDQATLCGRPRSQLKAMLRYQFLTMWVHHLHIAGAHNTNNTPPPGRAIATDYLSFCLAAGTRTGNCR
jgi:hypothetical protein